jgi:YVTN family beta-propeller protein
MKMQHFTLGLILIALVSLVGFVSASPFAYIPNEGNGTVSVIDIATNSVVTTIPDGAGSSSDPMGVAISPDGSKAYVTNNGANSVSVIDTATNTVQAVIDVGTTPFGIMVAGPIGAPNNAFVYVVNAGSNSVSVINTTTNNVVATIPVQNVPRGIRAVQNSIYVTNSGSNSVSIINMATNQVISNVTVGSSPYGIGGTQSACYVANSADGTVSVLNTSTNTVTGSFPVGKNPISVRANSQGSMVYVSNSGSNTISVINTASNSVTTINVGSNPEGMSLTPDGSELYVANQGDNTVSIINTASNILTATLQGFNVPVAFGKFITPAPTNLTNLGYSATVTAAQNTVITASNGAFGSVSQGGATTISNTVTLANAGGEQANVEASFTTSSSGIFGLVYGTSVIPASNVALGPTGSLVSLDNGGNPVQVATVPATGNANLDAKLVIPSTQAPGSYTGNITLTFSNG